MKKGKKLAALLLVFTMVLSLAACGGSSASEKTDISDSTSSVDVSESQTTDIEEDNEDSTDTLSEEEPVEESDSGDESSEEIISNEPSNIDDSDQESPLSYEEEEEPDDGLTPTQRNSINMLNYMTSLTQKVNEGKGNQLFLESAYDSFDNLFPNSVDKNTQAQITSLMDTIQGYRMISVKRERLVYIYEQNRAQALRQAIPNPIGLLSAVQSGSMLKAAVSVLYMAVDSASSYQAATSQADLQFLKDGWELDDAESAELHNSTKSALNYMLDMVRNYDIPGDYALNKSAVEDFVSWSTKPDSQLERKISWFESNQSTYSAFGPYWLELAKDYYNYGDYKKCLDAVHRYESISTRIFRKDIDYATTLPMAIISAKETMKSADYVKLASNYCSIIHDNTKDKDWTLRYFIAQIYMDLYAITKDSTYMDQAYSIARENVNYLVDEQKELNAAYLAEVKETKADKGATKREKEEVKQYNKTIKAERKIALPPVSEALYLNAQLLFELAKEKNISSSDQKKIESILHENGESIFLTKALDDRFWFDKTSGTIKAADISVDFDGEEFTIPASCITDRSNVSVTISGSSGTKVFEEWEVVEVKRPKNSKDCSEFMVTIKIKGADKYKYKDGENVTIKVTPVEETPDEHLDFKFNVVETTTAFVIKGVKFERVTK
ncbi:MAG: hypothetical protein IKG46_03980 [Solobacterium sp.]|nr:hypothetical protein [Solobacterium sp.]